jgi:hypothetical protein
MHFRFGGVQIPVMVLADIDGYERKVKKWHTNIQMSTS